MSARGREVFYCLIFPGRPPLVLQGSAEAGAVPEISVFAAESFDTQLCTEKLLGSVEVKQGQIVSGGGSGMFRRLQTCFSSSLPALSFVTLIFLR